MKGTALLLLCAVTLALAEQPQLTLSGKVCNCNPVEANNVCSQNGSDGELIVHENCNQFYKCNSGSAIPYFCPANLVYNPLAEICDWPENVECGNRPIVEVDAGNNGGDEDCDESSNGNGESGSGNGDGGSGDNAGTCNCNPGEAPSICAADGSDGILVANENCNQFYKCANGVPVVLNCPSGLVYNPYTEQCDWADKVECGDRPIVEIEGEGNNVGEEDCDLGNGNGESGGGDGESGGGNGESGGGNGESGGGNGDNGGTCNCNPDEAPEICSADGSDGTLVAHENCNQFYKCSHGAPVTINCPPGLVYNPQIECCDWPYNVDCGDKPIVEIEGGGNGDNGNGGSDGDNGTGGGTGGSSNEDNAGTCNCNPEEAPGICAVDGSDGTLVAHENCNQFYKCSHGKPVTISCPPGLVYNPYIECCDWPANVNCGDKPIVEVEGGGNGGDDNGNEGGNGDNGGGDDSGSDNEGGDNGGTCNCNPGEAPGICGADGSEGVLVAHENCNQFYKCSHGLPVALFCPEGLLYNPYIERCDWPALVDCGDRPVVEGGGGDNGGSDNGGGDNGGSDNGGSDNGSGDNGGGDNGGGDNGGTCNCNPGEAPGICGADGSEGVLVAHENCNQFYKCSHGLPVALFCPEGLLYNPYIERCDWPALVDCGDRPVVEGGGGDNGGSDNGGGDNGGSDNGGSDNGSGDNGGGDNGGGDNGGGDNDGTCNCNPGEAPGICGADGSEGVLVAHENCNQFYKCSHGLPVALFCPEGLLYNPYIERCDWSALVDCGDRPVVEGGGGDNGGSDNGGGDNGGSDNGGSDNGSGDNGGGDNGGGDNGGTCNCNPGEAPGICGADGSEGVLVAHENCNQFYKCSHGINVALFCPEGLHYNPHIERCDWPALVDCEGRPIVEGGGGDNGGSDNGGGDNDGSDNGGSDNGTGDNGGGDNGGTCNCNPGEAPEICGADGSEGVLVAHENCNQFYKCSHGINVALFCPEGLHYNPHIERCDWPALVDCEGRPIVEGGGGDNGGSDNGGGDNGGSDNGGSDNGGSDNGSGDNGGGDNGGGDNGGGDNGGTCNCNPGETPGICGADGSEGVLVAHENCNQFYKCSHGINVALFCPEGLHYNPHIERCDWPALVDCEGRPIVEGGGGDNGGSDNGEGDNNGSDNGGSDNGTGDNGGGDNGGTCNCNPGEAPGICGADGSEGVLVAHENCNQFYKCSHGINVALFCPEGLHYNPHTERCDWPALVDCEGRPIVEGGGGDNGGSDNGGGDNGGSDNGGSDNGGGDNGGTCNCNPGEAPGICGAYGSEGVLVAHENCNQFYKCSQGLPVALFCPESLLYNPQIERCDWPDLVECGDRPVVGGEGGDNDGSDNGGSDTGGNDNGGSDNGGNYGDTCDPSQAPTICAASGSDGVLVAHENCNQFYKCAEGAPVALVCPGNLLYNSELQVCDWPENVDCADRVIPVPEEEDNNGGGNDGGDTGGDNGGDSGGENGGSGGNSDPSEAPAICANEGSNGVLIAHENCDQFYVCSYGKPVALNCPSNLLYQPATEQCDWPQNVDCGDRIVPVPEDSGTDGPCACNSREAPSICARSESGGKLIAHENCNQYYVCFEGTPVSRICPHGLFYDPHTERCLQPASVNCEGRVISSNALNKHLQSRRGFF